MATAAPWPSRARWNKRTKGEAGRGPPCGEEAHSGGVTSVTDSAEHAAPTAPLDPPALVLLRMPGTKSCSLETNPHANTSY